jgi:uncharacterized protein YbjT (DUF2867 family)
VVTLVVGASGQVGSEVVRQLAEAGRPVRAMVRPDAAAAHLRAYADVEIVVGDLLQPGDVERAVAGSEHVIATANSVIPRKRGEFGRVEREGYPALIAAARDAGVQRFVFLSTSEFLHDDRSPGQQLKRFVERVLDTSGLEFAVVRPAAFMEAWLALPGSSLPLRGEVAPTLSRSFWFTRVFRKATGHLAEERGMLLVSGGPDVRTSFIAIRDVAALLIAAATHPAARNRILEVGGPEAVSWREVAAIYGRILGREVKIQASSPKLFAGLSKVLTPLSPAAGNIMTLQVGVADDMVVPPDVAAELGVGPLLRVEEFLEQKAALPADR